MQSSLGKRLAMLTFTQGDLARAAQVNRRTIYELATGKRKRGPHPLVSQAIERALLERELEVRDYLIASYGVPNGE